MADDALVLLLGRLEDTPAVRPAFAASLRADLHRELGFPEPVIAKSHTAMEPRTSIVRRLVESLRPVTPRAVLLVIVALLLLAGTVAAAYLALNAWLSNGPRGTQYTSDFTFAELFRQPGADYTDLKLAPDGRSIVAFRPSATWPPTPDPVDPAIVRFDLTGGGSLSPAVVLPLSRLRDPALWDPGTDVVHDVIERGPSSGFGDELSVAPNGDLFLSVSAYPAGGNQALPTASSLIVVRPDGFAQKVVTLRELAAAGLLGRHSTTGSVAATASAPDRLWARAEAPAESGSEGSAWWLFEIVDPAHDGDWSDRIVRPFVLPRAVPTLDDTTYQWRYGDFVAEPSIGGRDRSRSILLPMMSRDGEVRIYRVSDPNDDGNATDPGETELVFSGHMGPEAGPPMVVPMVAPRVVTEGSTIAIDELVVGGLTRPSRVSRITPTGVVDVARGVNWRVDDVLAALDGAIYVATQEPGDATKPSTFLIDRLTPVPIGAGPGVQLASSEPSVAPASLPPPSASPQESPFVSLRPVTPGVARIAVELDDSSGTRSETLVVGADGSGPAELVPGEHNSGFCQSADGSLVGFWSDEEVPNESFIYVARSDGSGRAKVSETATSFWCGFPGDAILLLDGHGTAHAIIRHDLATGAETTLVSDAVPLASSKDGRLLAIAPGPGAGTLEVLSVATGTRRKLAGPLEQTVRAAWWSPDGTRIAYVVGPPQSPDPASIGHYDTYLVDVAGGTPRRLASSDGRLPVVSWSADGRNVAVLAPTHETRPAEVAGRLVIVDAASGTASPIGDGDVVYAGWSPVGADTFAYATPGALYVTSVGGPVHEVAAAPTGALCPTCQDGPVSRWPGGEWMGWSPDGRFIGLGTFSSVLAVVEVATGRSTVLMTDTPASMLIGPRWWR